MAVFLAGHNSVIRIQSRIRVFLFSRKFKMEEDGPGRRKSKIRFQFQIFKFQFMFSIHVQYSLFIEDAKINSRKRQDVKTPSTGRWT
jgi:hypothetical protein